MSLPAQHIKIYVQENIYIPPEVYNTCGGEGDAAEATFLPEARRVVQRLDERVHVACRTQISKPNQRAIILWEEWKKERGGWDKNIT